VALRAVLFDFGNTLVSTRLDWARVVPRSLAELRDALRPVLTRVDLDRLGRDFLFMRRMAKERANLEMIEVPAADTLVQALALQGAIGTSEDLLENAVAAFFAPEERAYPLIFGITEVLAKLKEMGLKLAVVSNATSGALIRRALQRRGLLARFDHVAVSADLGPRKPDPSIFLGTTHALEVPAEACAMVGDLLDKDVEGARRAGMRAVLCDFLSNGVVPPPGGPHPDAIVRQPAELVDLFGSWMSA
jgi:HAD superfamily hydrolase (TIGR01509 family)